MKIEVRNVNGAARLDLTADTEEERKRIKAFVELANGGAIDKGAGGANPVFDTPARIESVGFSDDDGDVESIAIEAQIAG